MMSSQFGIATEADRFALHAVQLRSIFRKKMNRLIVLLLLVHVFSKVDCAPVQQNENRAAGSEVKNAAVSKRVIYPHIFHCYRSSR